MLRVPTGAGFAARLDSPQIVGRFDQTPECRAGSRTADHPDKLEIKNGVADAIATKSTTATNTADPSGGNQKKDRRTPDLPSLWS